MTTPSDASQAVELPPLPAKTVHELEPDSVRCVHLGHSDAAMCAFARAAIAQDRAARAQAEPDAVISGALFDFLGFLTTHETRWKFSAYDDASPAVQALEQWAEKRGLMLSEADVKGWRGARAQGAGEAVAGPSGDRPSDFQEGQWWLVKLDEVAAVGTDDMKRAVAVVRNLMKTAHAQVNAPTIPQAAEVPGCDPTQTECKRCRNVIANCDGVFSAALTPTASAPKACPHGDRFCPCPDGDTCHYEGANPSPAPKAEGEAARITPDEVKRIAEAYGQAMYDAGMDANSDFSDRRHDSDRKRDDANEDLASAIAALTQPPSEADRTREGGDVVHGADDRDGIVKRMRRVASFVGVSTALPEDDATVYGALFTCLGFIACKLERDRAAMSQPKFYTGQQD